MDASITYGQRRGPLLTKSRSGCRDCRLRKVKCDEIKPVCSNCRRRYIDIQCCDWSTNTALIGIRNSRRKTLRRNSINLGRQPAPKPNMNGPLPSTSSLSTYPSSVLSTERWRTLELRLMYHHTTVVSHSMPACSGASSEAWKQTIPQLAFDSELILNPMLALSALHLHAHSPNDSQMVISLRQFLGRSLAWHVQSLSGSLEVPSEQLWLSAVLLSHMDWLIAHQAQPNETYELPLQAFKILEGVGAIFEVKSASLGQQGYGWLGHETMPQIISDNKLSIASQTQLRSIEDDLTNLLDAFNVSELENGNKNIYMEAQYYVLYHYQMFFSGADAQTLQRFIAYMAVRCQPGYRIMLNQHDPLAMALMARMLVLLNEIDYAWWAHGKGEYEVVERDIKGMRGLMPKNLRWVMDWPCMVLNKEIILKRD